MENTNETEYLTIELSDGTLMKVEVRDERRFKEVGIAEKFSFQEVKKGIISYANDVKEIWDEVKPDKLTVEFGVEVEANTDNTLMAVLVQGKGKGNLNIKLEWERDK